MKKWFFCFLCVPFLFTQCKKKDTAECTYTASTKVASDFEKDSLRSWLDHHAISAIEDTSGFFYTNDSLGSGSRPTLCTNMTVKYKGFLLGHDNAFDSTLDNATSVLQLGSLVVGWQKAMPNVQAGGKVTLYIPPSLGYGDIIKRNGNGDTLIPKNSYLTFRIELISNQ